MRLTATFSVPLKSPIVLRGDPKPRSYQTSIGEFDVGLTILPMEGARSKNKNERLWTYAAEQLSVSIMRDESTRPPDVIREKSGVRNLTRRAQYFSSRLPQYRRVALEVVSNAIVFFRFELHQPLRSGVGGLFGWVADPEWFGDRGEPIDPGLITLVGRTIGTSPEFGIVKFERKHDKLFRAALTKPRKPKLYEEILSDSQAAAFDGNVRRAVLELAIACEVFAKHAFLGGDTTAAQVYGALEDTGKLNVRVLDLIDIGGRAKFGKAFRDVDKNAHTDIDHLFRVRNKIAHRGESVFRDDAGQLHTVDLKLLARWWRSALRLFAWAG